MWWILILCKVSDTTTENHLITRKPGGVRTILTIWNSLVKYGMSLTENGNIHLRITSQTIYLIIIEFDDILFYFIALNLIFIKF